MSDYYEIPLSGLKEGSHIYDFDVDRGFFNDFEESEIKECDLKVRAILIKRSVHLELEITLEGKVITRCDRCLEKYWQKVESKNALLIKYGDQWEEVDDEVMMMPSGESVFDLSQFIYEFAHLALPIKRVHPEDENGDSTCDAEMIKKLEEHISDNKEKIDPRWKDLGKLKDGLKN